MTAPRRDPAPYWLAAWIAFTVACTIWAAAVAVTQPGISSLIQVPIVIAVGAVTVIWWLRQRHHMAGPRAALLALIRDRDSESVWLNRDGHWAFQLVSRGWGPGRYWSVYRFAEDAIHDLSSGGQEDLLFMERYIAVAAMPAVLRTHESVLAAPSGDDGETATVRDVPDGPRWPVVYWRTLRWLATGALSAGPGEIRELITELAASEQVPQ